MLLSIAYFPTVEYFSVLAKYSTVYVEACENYVRQTWRNRCRILSAGGPMDLNFPVVHDGEKRIRHIRVDYKTPWVSKTEQAIDSAYYSSPFFEYYRDPLYGILDSHPETLWELDMSLMNFLLKKFGLTTRILETSEFVPPVPAVPVFPPENGTPANLNPAPGGILPRPEAAPMPVEDLRYSLSPKKASAYAGRPYWQVFREKFGFVPNLSAIDLLFNEGPESVCYF